MIPVGLLLPLLSENEVSVLLWKTPDGDDIVPFLEVPMDSTRFVVTDEDGFELVESLIEVTLLGLRTSASGPPIDRSKDERGDLPIDAEAFLLLALLSTVFALVQVSLKLNPLDFSLWRIRIGTRGLYKRENGLSC